MEEAKPLKKKEEKPAEAPVEAEAPAPDSEPVASEPPAAEKPAEPKSQPKSPRSVKAKFISRSEPSYPALPLWAPFNCPNPRKQPKNRLHLLPIQINRNAASVSA
jgi:hypothetical protein